MSDSGKRRKINLASPVDLLAWLDGNRKAANELRGRMERAKSPEEMPSPPEVMERLLEGQEVILAALAFQFRVMVSQSQRVKLPPDLERTLRGGIP